ncbi:MAG: acyltransferase [Burkholderiales bacterium]|nr:acyltransferase [Bacteroidia bacterium]
MHKNNFDFLRLIFALFVIVTHSITLSGSASLDPMQLLTAKQFTLSDLGLAGFFTISGYLVFESLKRSKSLTDYYIKRIVRIYPGLIVALIVTIIAGGIVSDLSLNEYFSNVAPYKYFFLKLSMFFRPNELQRVFMHNPFPNEANGSLWTIPYEFLFYVLLSLLFFIRNKMMAIIFIVTFVYLLAIVTFYGKGDIIPGYLYYYIKMPFRFFQYDVFFSFGFYFCAGVILANFKGWLNQYKGWVALLSLSLSGFFVLMNYFIIASHFVLPFFIISIGLMQTRIINDLGSKIGDFSYGIYIYGFLIQQILMDYYQLNYFQLLVITIPISFISGYISWNFIEKPFLQFKLKQAPNLLMKHKCNN